MNKNKSKILALKYRPRIFKELIGQEVIAETGAEGMKDFGKIMKTLVPEFKGKADNSLIKELANEYLN